MEKAVRRKYTGEFKEEAVKLVTDQGYKISEASRNLGIHNTQLRRWVKGKLPRNVRFLYHHQPALNSWLFFSIHGK